MLGVVLTSQTDMLLPFEDLETPPTQNQGSALTNFPKHQPFPEDGGQLLISVGDSPPNAAAVLYGFSIKDTFFKF